MAEKRAVFDYQDAIKPHLDAIQALLPVEYRLTLLLRHRGAFDPNANMMLTTDNVDAIVPAMQRVLMRGLVVPDGGLH